MLQTGIINDHLQQILVTVNSCIIFNFQVKVLRNPASIERHTGAGGKGGKITKLLLCINLIFKGKYPPPPSALRGHVPGIHRGITNHLHISSQGEIKTTHRCSGSLNKQKAALPAGPSCPIDQPVAQRVAPEETCESIFRQKSTITALDPLLSFCPLLSNVGMLLKPCGCHFLFCFIFRAPPARTRER